MKVIMLCKYPSDKDWGGVATHLRFLSQCLEKKVDKSFQFYIISFGYKKNYTNIKKNFIIINIHWYYYIFPLLALVKIFIEINKIHPDVIHIQGTNISPYSLFSLLNLILVKNKNKFIFTLHNIYHLELASDGKIKKDSMIYKLIFYLEKLFLKQASHIIVVNTHHKRYLIRNLSINRNIISVIYNGVDVEEFNPNINRKIIRDMLKLKQNDFILIYAKLFSNNNGPQYLLKSLPYILEKFPNVKILLVGAGPLKNELIAISKELNIKDNIIFTGIVNYKNMKYYLAASDTVIIPSITYSGFVEGLPNIMLEGMAMGKPVIASSVGGLKEIINDRNIGILVKEKDEKAIAKAVIHLITEPEYQKYLGRNAREFVSNNLSWSHVASETYNIYNNVLKFTKK